jgi:hypothetical protein
MVAVRGRLVLLAGAIVLACVAAGSTGGAGASRVHDTHDTGAPQLTVAGAQQAFSSTWPKFESAYVQGQPEILQKYATARFLEAAAEELGCGCATTAHSKTLFSIPPGTHYPVSFLAQISTPSPRQSVFSPFVTMVVFTKADARDRWRVAYMVRYSGTHRYVTASKVAAAPRATFPITEVGEQLAQFFNGIVDTGTPPADDNWPQTGSTGQEVQGYLETKTFVQSQGDQQATVFTAIDHSDAFASAVGDIMCADYTSMSSVTPAPGHTIVQPSDQITWGSMLAPGAYSGFTKMGMHQVCYAVNTKASRVTDGVTPLSFFESVYSAVGTPVSGTIPPQIVSPAP